MRRLPHALAAVALALAGCGADDDGAGERPTTSSTSAAVSTVTTATSGVVLADVLDRIEGEMDYEGEFWIERCRDDYGDPSVVDIRTVDPEATVGRGTVLLCTPGTDPIFDLGSMLLVVVDDVGTSAHLLTTDANPLLPFTAESGLLCRELLADPVIADDRSSAAYVVVLAYWFREGEPVRMDADADGIPCEQLFSSRVVRDVWGGNA